jgi:AraC-like DNA-binding protein
MHLLTFISLVGVLLSVFFAARLWVQPTENTTAARAFAGFLGCAALFVFDDACYRENWFARWPALYGAANPFIAAIGPCFFLYAQAVTVRAWRWRWLGLLHFLPVGLIFLLELPTYLSPPAEKLRQAAADFDVAARGPADYVLLAALDVYLLVYLGLSWRQLWRGRDRLEESREEGRSHPLRGIGLFATLVLAVTIVSAVLDFTPWARTASTVPVLAVVLAVFALLWTAGQPTALVAPVWPAEPPPPAPTSTATAVAPEPAPAPAEKKDAAGINPDELARLVARLRQLIETEHVYLDADLSLQSLAERAKTTRHKMSAALRAAYGATFYQVVASRRVRAAARVLETHDGAIRTIADIALSSGFNTLSAFNAAFRAEFGVTPSAFRDAAQKKRWSP